MRLHPFLASFQALLLDLNGTFMFGQDRFGPDEDYHATYLKLGGSMLDRADVHIIVDETLGEMKRQAHCPDLQVNFPIVSEILVEYTPAVRLPDSERAILADTFAVHEVGSIPDEHAQFLKNLAESHRLGVVSNIFSTRERFKAEIDRAGLTSCIESVVFSSDIRVLKPAPAIFIKAIGDLRLERSDVAFIGDNPTDDIAGARAIGLATIWIDDGTRDVESNEIPADLVLSSLLDLSTD